MWPLRDRWLSCIKPNSTVCLTAAEYVQRSTRGEADLELIPAWKVKPKSYDFQISVFARVRPLDASETALDDPAIVLPLHQV